MSGSSLNIPRTYSPPNEELALKVRSHSGSSGHASLRLHAPSFRRDLSPERRDGPSVAFSSFHEIPPISADEDWHPPGRCTSPTEATSVTEAELPQGNPALHEESFSTVKEEPQATLSPTGQTNNSSPKSVIRQSRSSIAAPESDGQLRDPSVADPSSRRPSELPVRETTDLFVRVGKQVSICLEETVHVVQTENPAPEIPPGIAAALMLREGRKGTFTRNVFHPTTLPQEMATELTPSGDSLGCSARRAQLAGLWGIHGADHPKRMFLQISEEEIRGGRFLTACQALLLAGKAKTVADARTMVGRMARSRRSIASTDTFDSSWRRAEERTAYWPEAKHHAEEGNVLVAAETFRKALIHSRPEFATALPNAQDCSNWVFYYVTVSDPLYAAFAWLNAERTESCRVLQGAPHRPVRDLSLEQLALLPATRTHACACPNCGRLVAVNHLAEHSKGPMCRRPEGEPLQHNEENKEPQSVPQTALTPAQLRALCTRPYAGVFATDAGGGDVRVVALMHQGPAHVAGLRVGDSLRVVDLTDVHTLSDVSRALLSHRRKAYRSGAVLSIERGENQLSFPLKLASLAGPELLRRLQSSGRGALSSELSDLLQDCVGAALPALPHKDCAPGAPVLIFF